ncbi:MAG: GYDIA family GHMP kinase [Flavobacteriaceae bacterium]
MRYFAHGKLLLTAEYAVLGGATALAVPTKLGQWLEVNTSNTPEIRWKSIDEKGAVWYENQFNKATFMPRQQDAIGNRLQELFLEIATQNSNAFTSSSGFSFVTTLDFNRDWGLGSSATLNSLLAQWGNVNPYQLQQQVFGGSGYDVACATAKGAIHYVRTNPLQPTIIPVDFSPNYKDHLFFVHLNQKQNSQEAVAQFDRKRLTPSKLAEISSLTAAFSTAESVEYFQELMRTHEELVGGLLGATPVQKRLFSDYKGAIKSLGAWGGDFVLACGDATTPAYFAEKGYKTCLAYDALIYDGS